MMAHEVKNTIGPVNSILQSAISSPAILDVEKNKPLANALQVAADRNQNLNIFMRKFAEVVRLPEPYKRPVDLHKIIQNVLTLMERSAADKQIIFVKQLSANPVIINADEQQLEQALINIIKNATESIDASGTVTITTDGNQRTLAITDTGKGIT